MSTDRVAGFGLWLADPNIPWPPRGSGERLLVDREGWQRRAIPAVIRGERTTIEAAVRGDLAVNPMIEGEGFAIATAAEGWRISYGGRVFARSQDAMSAAEAMLAADTEWAAVPRLGLSPHQCRVLKAITDAAEQRGEILLDRVYPAP